MGDGEGGWLRCCLCGRPVGDGGARLHLTHGVAVHLCSAHRSEGYLTRAGGTVFCERLARVWAAAGALSASRVKALQSHLRNVGLASPVRARPGSYSWPRLRREAEGRFAAGEPPGLVIRDLRLRHRDDTADVPSVRTMRRWFAERRWLSAHRAQATQTVPARRATRWERVRQAIEALPYMTLLVESFPYIPNVAALGVQACTPRARTGSGGG